MGCLSLFVSITIGLISPIGQIGEIMIDGRTSR